MIFKSYSIYLSSVVFLQFALGSYAAQENDSIRVLEKTSDAGSETIAADDILSEDFWLYMAEFSDDEELINSDMSLSEMNKVSESVKQDSKVKQDSTVKQDSKVTSSVANNMPETSEGSL